MELIISFIGVLLTMFGSFMWLSVTLGDLQRRLETLEGKKHFEQAEQEFMQEIEHTLKSLHQQQLDLEQQRERLISELAKIKRNSIKKPKQEIYKLKLSVVPAHDPITTLAETLPEITFEAAFIDRDKKIRRETRKARQLIEILPGNVKLELIYIPGGSFMMGSNDGYNDEKPVHPVTMKSFFAGKYPVTQAQWAAVMGNNPSYFKGANRPVEHVNWHEAMAYCAKLSQLTGQHYRLLSEARWEYACRARTTTKYSFGNLITPELANYTDSDIKQTTEVGNYPTNGFGLYDMHGNVWEWCEDVWHENYHDAPTDGSTWDIGKTSKYHLVRGGAWSYGDDRLRCTDRFRLDAMSKFYNWGFRISRI